VLCSLTNYFRDTHIHISKHLYTGVTWTCIYVIG